MNLLRSLAVGRSRRVWTDPVRRYRTLLSFSDTEQDGGKDLVLAAKRISDPELRAHIERHAKDEVRHAELFRTRAAEVQSEAASAALGAEKSDRAYDLSRGRAGHEVDAHGFFSAGLIDEMGELEYVAMLHVAEQRAAELFSVYHEGCAEDEGTREVFAEILRDEKYHVAYTGRFLERWRAAGREREVERALAAARGSRILGAWKRLGLRSAAGFSQVVLFVMYWTVLLPFGLLACRGRAEAGWREARESASGGSQAGLRSQY
jgi:rubrerythrin